MRSHRSNLRILLALLCLCAQLSLSSADFWHHHADDAPAHDECPVCIAVAQHKSDGFPPVIFLAPSAVPVDTIAVSAERDASTSLPTEILPRGPPSA